MSICKRVIARLDVKGIKLIKGIQFEGLRVLGDAWPAANKYSNEGIDEIFYADAVASLYGRNSLAEILKNTSKDSFIPITAGGGIRSVNDGKKLLANGADKLAINSHAVKNPDLINQLAKTFGKQCVVISIQARKSIKNDTWDIMIESGRDRSIRNLEEWILEVQERGAGEILLTSVDQDGTCKGPDFELINKVSPLVSIPLVVGGGFSQVEQINQVFNKDNSISGVAIGWALHSSILKIENIKNNLIKDDISVRPVLQPKIKNNARKSKVCILDYGMGNIESLFNAFNYIGTEVVITDSKSELEKADLIAIPGVGSFPEGMKNLELRKFIPIINERFKNKQAILGICLGMQLFFSKGEEYGLTNGLNLLKGKVVKLPSINFLGRKVILPHLGWNKISFKRNSNKYSFKNQNDIYQYFVHSYEAIVDDQEKETILCETEYGGYKFVSAINKDNLFGLQFHPERSGSLGLLLLKDIINQIK